MRVTILDVIQTFNKGIKRVGKKRVSEKLTLDELSEVTVKCLR